MGQAEQLSTQAWQLGTKADTLAALEGQLSTARVLPQVRFTVGEWLQDGTSIVTRIASAKWGLQPLIVRSSAIAEDQPHGGSLAGRYTTVAEVSGIEALVDAVEQVIASYGPLAEFDQVFVQPMLENVRACGVAFSRDPSTNSPYTVVNVDESGSTDAVTAGNSSDLRTLYYADPPRGGRPEIASVTALARYQPVCALIEEIQTFTGLRDIDIEFAVDEEGELVLFQVRPLKIPGGGIDDEQFGLALEGVVGRINRANQPHPYLHGSRTVFGVMPDWNPAEIIGSRPRPLALSLYRELVTDSIWAYQRDNYGYRNLRSFPLLVSFHGLPYIDVRLSFNSFLPKDLPAPIAEKLVDHYVDRLLAHPTLHDKVEFEITYSCYTLDLPDRMRELIDAGFSEGECGEFASSLRRLTNRVIHGETGLWRQDTRKIDELEFRRQQILDSELDPVARIWWLIEDCKRYGTLPFAGLARCGFIAVQMLRSLVAIGVMSADDYDAFFRSLSTVSSALSRDFRRLSREDFLQHYGHLRPGTYDILSARYDESPDRYFDWESRGGQPAERPAFQLSAEATDRLNLALREHGIEHDARSLMDFIRSGIIGREYAKFVFSRSLSEALSSIARLGEEHGLTRDDCSFLDASFLRQLMTSSGDIAAVMQESTRAGRASYEHTRSLILPPILRGPEDVWSIELPKGEPNYITQKIATGSVVTVDSAEIPPGSILLMQNADPGYDWIFSRGIAGFVTAFGGANSHMAIRASELGIPAVIGAGEALFGQLAGAADLTIDCANRRVEVIRKA